MINLKNKIKNSRVENTIGVLFCYIGILIAKKKKGVRHNYKHSWKTRLEFAREYETPKLKTLDPNPSSLSPLPSDQMLILKKRKKKKEEKKKGR